MALIPPPKNTTHAAIDAALYARQPDPRRDHLGASIIGRSCWREIWYSFRWATFELHDGQLLRLFDRGHEEEHRFEKYMKRAGFEFWPVNPTTRQQFTWSVHGGHFGGSCDGFVRGIPEAPVAMHLTEMKTHNDKNFQMVRIHGVEKGKQEHAIQGNQYAYWANENGTDCNRILYMAVNKNDDELYTERLKLDKPLAQRMEKKALDIITSDRAPKRIREDKTHYYCEHFCDHADTCNGQKVASASCRTCASLTADTENGGWHCSHFKQEINSETQRRGEKCPAHLFIPDLIPFAEPIDACEDPRAITYRIKGTDFEFTNSHAAISGKLPHYPSEMLQHMRPELIQDKALNSLITKFDGAVIASEASD